MIHHSIQGLLSLAFWSPSPSEMIIVAVIALLLYGGDLPKVARSWGKTFAEFRRGLSGIQNDLNDAIYSEPEQIEYRTNTDQGYIDADYSEPADDVESTSSDDKSAKQDADEVETESAEADPSRRD